MLRLQIYSLIIFLFSLYSNPSFAQNRTQEDSLKIYKKVEQVAKKKKTTYWLYKEIFNLPNRTKTKESAKRKVSYQSLKGKIIRNIYVQSLDPFGYTVKDTSKSPHGIVEKGLNVLHQKSARRSIQNRLLYKTGDTLDPLKVKESERILRSAPQIREIETIIKKVPGTDSVDVYIRSQDYFSKTVGVSYSPDEYVFDFADKNFLGLAHYFKNDLTYYPGSGKYVASGVYSIPYISNTQIIPTLNYSSDPDNFVRGVGISRPFISPLFTWAGHAQFYDVKSTGSEIVTGDTIDYATRNYVKDFWIGRSFKLAEDTSEEVRVTRLITGVRFFTTDYKYYAPEIVAPHHFFEDIKMVLFNIGLSNRSYYRDNYIYRFGVEEDVPAGRIFNLTTGYEFRPGGDRLYAALEAGKGNYYDNFGYLTMRTSMGTFLRNLDPQQSVFKINMGYFSDLISFHKTHFRQFVKLGVTYGLNRIRKEQLDLNSEIRGFESGVVNGTKKATLSLQTQAYLPYRLLGFHFAPFVFIDFGLIANSNQTLLDSRMYQGYGLGIIIKNELLVINTFQFSLGYYPFIPDKSGGMFRFNPSKSYDFAFDDFQIQDPAVIPLQ